MRTEEDQLARKVAALCRPETYADAPARIEVIETHMSFVFLTPLYAYKMKKPVRYDFLDFSTAALRAYYCAEELRLNRRLAPGVYIAVVPLGRGPNGGLRLGSGDDVVERLVQMRRLPRDRMLDECIRRGALDQRALEALAVRLACFYQNAPAEAISPAQYRALLLDDIETDRAALQGHAARLDEQAIAQVHATQTAYLDRASIDARVADHRIVEGHGDLRPEHVCLLDEPVVFDCIEFNRRFRIVDPLGELAFLAMECERLGAANVGSALVSTYVARSGDCGAATLLDFYKLRAASLRARLCILHTRELDRMDWGRWVARAGQYLAAARAYALRLQQPT